VGGARALYELDDAPLPDEPFGGVVRAPYWGTRAELMEVLDLARAGAVHVEVEKYALDEAPEAYRRLHEGAVRGPAVVVPGA
jgi:propanol-preferring alcohol dehydrogenase